MHSTMFNENEKEWILEAINHLKRRKARPDFSRISLRMKRKHHLTFAQTKQLLESLIESGIVVKAVYKNNTSYRDVSKWKKGRLGGQILNSSKMLKRFVTAIKANERDNKSTGVSAKVIEEWLRNENEDKCFLSGAALRDALQNEVENGYLTKKYTGLEMYYSVVDEKLKSARLELDLDLELDTESQDSRGSPRPQEEDETKVTSPHESDREEDVGSDADSANKITVSHLLSNLMMAICETEETEGNGSSFQSIENWLRTNQSFTNSFRDLPLESFIEHLTKNNLVHKTQKGSICLYSVNEQTLDNEHLLDASMDIKSIPSSSGKLGLGLEVPTKRVSTKPEDNSISKPEILLKGDEDHHLSGTGAQKTSSKAAPVSLRPPSKRKRVQKDHGPDFEMELPTKSRSKFVPVSENKECTFPTPVDSPVSEKSETAFDQSFKVEAKRKRGRPKKLNSSSNIETASLDALEDGSSRQGIPSEQSSVYNEEYEEIGRLSFPDASSWTAQQVADYFKQQGYEEESKQMFDNDLDGAALALLRRSDIVGPPLGGILKIKKLGTALKLFRDIRNLLFQGNIDNYADPYEERAFVRS